MNEMNKIITSEGNVQFQTADGNIINVHPFHIYTTFNEDTVSFILIAMPKYSGLAIFTSKASDLEVDGTVYTIEQLPNALSEAFAKAGAVARYEIVDELPTSGQSNTIYLLPKSEGIGYDEYIYVNGEWELIGDTDIEFNKYLTKEAFSAYSAATELKIDGKVVELTQAEYDAMVSGGTIDPLVLYVITDAVEVNMNDYYKKTETSGATELSTAFANEASARTDADNAISAATSGKLDTSVFETYSGNVETALDAKVNTSDFNTYSANTQTAINAKQDTLVAGSGITISGNVISAEAQPITVDPSLDSGSTNAVANSAITIAIDELSASSVTNCDNVVIEDAIPTPPSTIVDENVKVSWEDDYTETYAVDYEGDIGDGVEHVRYNVSKLEFGSFTTGIGLNFRFSSDDCYRDLKTVIFNGNVNFGEQSTAFASAFNLEAVYFYAPNPSAITSNYSFSWDFLNSVYDGCETYETSAATYLIYVADLAAYSGARLYSDGGDDVTWGQHFGNRLQEIPKDKKLVLTDIDSRLAEDEEVTASGLNALNDKFDGLKLKKLTQAEYDALVTKDSNTLYIVID